jgi:hypothetical protein
MQAIGVSSPAAFARAERETVDRLCALIDHSTAVGDAAEWQEGEVGGSAESQVVKVGDAAESQVVKAADATEWQVAEFADSAELQRAERAAVEVVRLVRDRMPEVFADAVAMLPGLRRAVGQDWRDGKPVQTSSSTLDRRGLLLGAAFELADILTAAISTTGPRGTVEAARRRSRFLFGTALATLDPGRAALVRSVVGHGLTIKAAAAESGWSGRESTRVFHAAIIEVDRELTRLGFEPNASAVAAILRAAPDTAATGRATVDPSELHAFELPVHDAAAKTHRTVAAMRIARYTAAIDLLSRYHTDEAEPPVSMPDRLSEGSDGAFDIVAATAATMRNSDQFRAALAARSTA